MTENSILLLPLQPLLLLDELSKIPRRGASRSVKKCSWCSSKVKKSRWCSSIRCVAKLLLFLRRRVFHRG